MQLQVLVHLAGQTVDVLVQPVALGLQGKKRRQTRPLNPGVGTGERLDLGYPTFTYDNAEPGFAETDLEEYDHLSADLAFTRTLKALRKGYSRDPDLERRWEDHVEGESRSISCRLNMLINLQPSSSRPTLKRLWMPTYSTKPPL